MSTLLKQLEATRAGRTPIAAKRDALVALPRDPNYVAAQLRETLERAAARRREGFEYELRRCAQHGYGLDELFHVTSGRVVDLAAPLALVLGVDRVCEYLAPYIDALPEGITAEARTAELAILDAELIRLETIEEDLVCRLEEAGIPAARRGNANPALVLAIREPQQ